MNPGTYIGIDPGQKGAITIITINGGNHSLKTTPFKDMTDKDIASRIQRASLNTPQGHNLFAMVEHIHIFGKQKGAHKLVKNYGMLLGYCVACDVPFEEPTPKTWQKHYGLEKMISEPDHRFKTRMRQKAEQLFPQLAPIPVEVADSILIAYYCLTIKTRL